jgi:uncharacterized protein (TIGR02118 family)
VIKLAFFVRRHPELSVEQFRDHALTVYLPLLKKLPGLKKIVLNFSQEAEGTGRSNIDVMAELWFDSIDRHQKALHSPQGDAVRKDRHGFFDETRSTWALLEEMTIK